MPYCSQITLKISFKQVICKNKTKFTDALLCISNLQRSSTQINSLLCLWVSLIGNLILIKQTFQNTTDPTDATSSLYPATCKTMMDSGKKQICKINHWSLSIWSCSLPLSPWSHAVMTKAQEKRWQWHPTLAVKTSMMIRTKLLEQG